MKRCCNIIALLSKEAKRKKEGKEKEEFSHGMLFALIKYNCFPIACLEKIKRQGIINAFFQLNGGAKEKCLMMEELVCL
jgi:hypothetical protein